MSLRFIGKTKDDWAQADERTTAAVAPGRCSRMMPTVTGTVAIFNRQLYLLYYSGPRLIELWL